MASDVYFIDLRATVKENFVQKLERLLETAGISRIVNERDLTAVKIHFGERGNTAFIRPVYIGKLVECIKSARSGSGSMEPVDTGPYGEYGRIHLGSVKA